MPLGIVASFFLGCFPSLWACSHWVCLKHSCPTTVLGFAYLWSFPLQLPVFSCWQEWGWEALTTSFTLLPGSLVTMLKPLGRWIAMSLPLSRMDSVLVPSAILRALESQPLCHLDSPPSLGTTILEFGNGWLSLGAWCKQNQVKAPQRYNFALFSPKGSALKQSAAVTSQQKEPQKVVCTLAAGEAPILWGRTQLISCRSGLGKHDLHFGRLWCSRLETQWQLQIN